ncbi:IucA/IucC family C-terminal-domain containing protein [Pseudalkalibacillus hwajinpoensis]|uniref:IucA/IucC family C-terminal-domain containing protein n=1 Tax=Guptibacillus hwajinpoensis TaxID=208199 RepID=UPI00325A48BD
MVAKQQVFNLKEKEKLELLRLQVGAASHMSIRQLLDANELKALLERLVTEGHFPSLVVAGSQFTKRYGFMAIAPILYAFTMWNKPVDAGTDKLAYRLDLDAEPWMINLVIDDEWIDPSKDRSLARSELANKVINENLAPFVEAMVKATKLSAAILWENVSIYLFWLYETLIPSEGDKVQKRRAEEDLHYFLREFNCTSFTCGANPFLPYYTEKTETTDGAIRFRRTCCLYDQVSVGGACCKTCPKAR